MSGGLRARIEIAPESRRNVHLYLGNILLHTYPCADAGTAAYPRSVAHLRSVVDRINSLIDTHVSELLAATLNAARDAARREIANG